MTKTFPTGKRRSFLSFMLIQLEVLLIEQELKYLPIVSEQLCVIVLSTINLTQWLR
jgi:hypothetical protein